MMKKILYTILLCAVMIGFTVPNDIAHAAICNTKSECDQMLKENQKAASSQRIKIDSAQNAIDSLNDQIGNIQNGINIRNQQIDLTNQQIDQTQAQIDQKTKELAAQKAKLNETVVVYYENSNQSTLTTVVGSNSLSEAIDRAQYLEAIGSSLNDAITKINQMMADLKTQSESLTSAKNDLEHERSALASQKSQLGIQQQTQQNLLSNSENTLASLRTQQADIEARKRQLSIIYSRGGKGSPVGSQLVSSIDGGWYYNQNDYPNDYLGNSGLSIKQAGCLITSIAMIATKYGNRISPPGVVDASSFTGDGGWAGFNQNIGISVKSSQSVNWDTVNNELNQGHPVIVSVYVGGPRYNSDGSNHFIVLKGISNGKYLIQDPYWTNSSYDESDVISMKIVSN